MRRGRERSGAASVRAEFRPLDAARWLRVEIDASSAASAEGLLDLVRDRLARGLDGIQGTGATYD